MYFETELADSQEVRYKSKRGINDASRIATLLSVWVHVAGKMELLVFEMGLDAEGHVNLENYIIR